jgi:hydrogenase maturation protein HypF
VPPPSRDQIQLQAAEPARLKLLVRGAVQGVGFRPFVFRLASGLGLGGWVSNSSAGVLIEVEADRARLETFLDQLRAASPPRSVVESVETAWLEPVGYRQFEIRGSDPGESKTTLVLPDIATCPDCLREILDPADRRFGYPFTNCTNCGPRFTIIEELPYDRVRTSMKGFRMCEDCRREYEDPLNRRFHAQPNACPKCGPHLELWDGRGHVLLLGGAALEEAAGAIASGAIVAVKGVGGFHLCAAAHHEEALARLRHLKRREEKPFALLFPSLERVQQECEVSALEKELLQAPAGPIVLLHRQSKNRNAKTDIAELVAPGNPYLGVMLPSNPLHHLLLRQVGGPIVATSGNLSEEPICIDQGEAVQRLGGIASCFLIHDRPIVRHADDSIARVMAGRELILRRARGYAPLPIRVENLPPYCVLGVGAHLKNTVALAVGSRAFVSQHIGDLETPQAYAAFQRVITDFESFYEAHPQVIAADDHPDYLSTRYAKTRPETVAGVQHHYAHVLACMAEHNLQAPLIGIAWDGTGLGSDHTIWGGEFLRIGASSFERAGHLRTFRLPGGDKAAREPRRSALALLYELYGNAAFEMKHLAPVRAFSDAELGTLQRMLSQNLNTPLTSSAGRLFDAAAALLGLRQRCGFEGQAAMELEFALEGLALEARYPVGWQKPDGASLVLDWAPVVAGLIEDLEKKLPTSVISMKFHNSLVEGIVQFAQEAGLPEVVLSGGCFQNKYLTERSVAALQQAGFRPHWHRWVPPNDGGVALGQVLAVRRRGQAAG